jgi:hypothetical protein
VPEITPRVLPVSPGSIPKALQAIPQWVLWSYERRGDKWTKVPSQADGCGLPASVSAPHTWSEFSTAVLTYTRSSADGIGLVLTDDLGLVGFDFDHCRNPDTGDIESWAMAHVDALQSYTEVTPSGTGLRVLTVGTMSEKGRKVGNREMYRNARYLTVTGCHLQGTPGTIEPRQAAIDAIYRRFFQRPQAQSSLARNGDGAALSDEELLARARRARNGEKFDRLWDGDIAGYAMHSEADLALCRLLAFWTRDATQIDRMFKESRLMRDKWDERHGADTYGERTIAMALQHITPDGHEGHGASAEQWPEALALPEPLAAVEPFEPNLLPEVFRPWIEDIAERMQCPPDYPAVAAMTAHAAVVGRRVGIRPKRQDDWLVVANLWGGVIGPPGVLKTPAIQEALKPLQRLEFESGRAYEAELQHWETDRRLLEEEEKIISGDIRVALKQGARPEAERLAARLQAQHSQAAPVRHRLIVNDTTVEKLGELLNQNPNGLLIFRDELTGFLRALDREGHETDRAFYLEAWNGTGRFVYDRIGRGTIDIQAACVSILGSIQPGPLGHYLRGTLEGGVADDGLMQRFQLLVWPDVAREWKNIDRWPESAAKRIAYETLQRMHTLTAASVDATCDEEHGGIPYLRFDDAAHELFTEWRAELEHRLRGDDDHPALLAHLAKYRSLIPSLALLIHLADGGKGSVRLDAVERACGWADYLESHARRVYGRGMAQGSVAAAALARKIQAREVASVFSAREVYRHHWVHLATPDEVDRAARTLADYQWLRVAKQNTGGRPTQTYIVNPRVWEKS